MGTNVKSFADSARGLSKSPLGIIALFIVLVYGFATLAFTVGRNTQCLVSPLIYFLVFFPVIVFAGFLWLVSKHDDKIYGPSDYKKEKNYVKMKMYSLGMLVAAAGKPQDSGAQTAVTASQVSALVEVVSKTNMRTSRKNRAEQKNRILWVDDRPENNVYEREAFESQGLEVSIALSSDEALERLNVMKFSIIISDMGRKEGPNEGYVLLEKLRNAGNKTPFFIYASSNLPEHRKAAIERGAQGSTNNARELYEMVMSTISSL
jgi:CheY-like chemotaxis protein